MEKKKGAVSKFFEEFKKFITRGNVLDMSVGVIVGGAFTGIVNGLSNFILKPIINWLLSLILPGEGLEAAITTLGEVVYTLDADGNQIIDLTKTIYIDWGSFISAIINFLLIAIVLFSIVKLINSLNEARDKAEDEVADRRKMRKAIAEIKKAEKVNGKKAKAIYEQRLAEAAAAKAAEAAAAEAAAAAKAAEEAKLAEEKAMQNTVLLQEILAVLKNK